MTAHFSEVVYVKMVIFTKFWVKGDGGDFLIDFITVALVYIPKQIKRTVPLVGGWGLFEDVGDLAEIFFVGVDGTFEDGGLRDYLFVN